MVAGPKGMSAAQIAYWENAFARLTQTEEWKKDLEQNLFENTYMNSADARKYLQAQYGAIQGRVDRSGACQVVAVARVGSAHAVPEKSRNQAHHGHRSAHTPATRAALGGSAGKNVQALGVLRVLKSTRVP